MTVAAHKREPEPVVEIDHTCTHKGCQSYAPYGFREPGSTKPYRWYCAEHLKEGEVWHCNNGRAGFARRAEGW